jgi:hypothetical protein
MCRITRCEHRITRCSQSICIHELICLILQDANTVSQDAYTTVSTCMYVNDIQPIHTYTLSMPIHTHTLSSSYDFQNDKSTVLVPNKSQDLNFGGLQATKKKKAMHTHTHTHTHTKHTFSALAVGEEYSVAQHLLVCVWACPASMRVRMRVRARARERERARARLSHIPHRDTNPHTTHTHTHTQDPYHPRAHKHTG